MAYTVNEFGGNVGRLFQVLDRVVHVQSAAGYQVNTSQHTTTTMPSAQKLKAKAQDVVESDHQESTDDDSASPSTSKKTRRSKISKALDALHGKSEIPQALVDQVLDKVKAEGTPGSSEATQQNVREVLEQLKIMDVMKGKAGLGGVNKKDVGEHKVGYRPGWASNLDSLL